MNWPHVERSVAAVRSGQWSAAAGQADSVRNWHAVLAFGLAAV